MEAFNLHGEFDFSDERMINSMGLTHPRNISIKQEKKWRLKVHSPYS